MAKGSEQQLVDQQLSRREMLGIVAAAGAAFVAGCGGGSSSSVAATNTPAPTPTRVPPTNTLAPTSTATASPKPPTTTPTAAATATHTASPTPATLSCVVRPEQTEGPYFVDERLNRSDIRSDPSDGLVSDGALLELTFRVSQVSGGSCIALAGATVDVWHCDALGIYSDVSDPSFNTVGQMFLRGYQVTDANGTARFTTIYPGWYQGRTVHVHFKIRTDPDSSQGYEFTSQLYFDDTITDQVHSLQPYASKGQRTLRNDGDGIFQNGGDQLLLAPAEVGDGYAATFDIGLQIA